MEYVSPSDAFSSSLEHSLLQRAVQERQARQDQLAQQREARIARIDEEERQQAREALAEKRQEFADSQKEKRKGSFEKSVSTMLPGDIPSPDLLAQAKEFGMGHLFPETEPTLPLPTQAPEMAAPAASDSGMAPMGTEDNPTPAPTGGGMRFIGSPKQRQDAADKDEALQYTSTLPDGPQKQAMEYFIKTGKTPPAGMFKQQGEDGTPVARVDPRRQVVQRLVAGKWTDVTGDVPKGTHFLQEPTPPSTAGADSRKDAARTRVYNTAVTELNKTALPYEGQLKNLDDAAEVLNQRTPAGDAHVAPMVLKALVAGQGSGFRMTKAEIDQVQNARSLWQSMEAKFRKWSSNPGEALFFDDAQRAEFGKLLATVKVATARHLDQITQARNDIDLLDDPRDIQKRVTGLHNQRLTDAKGGGDDKKAKTLSVADIKAKYGVPQKAK